MNNTTDNSQEFAQTTKNNNESANNSVSNSVNNKKSIKSKAIQAEKPLMRYFDLIDEANSSYVLGYN